MLWKNLPVPQMTGCNAPDIFAIVCSERVILSAAVRFWTRFAPPEKRGPSPKRQGHKDARQAASARPEGIRLSDIDGLARR